MADEPTPDMVPRAEMERAVAAARAECRQTDCWTDRIPTFVVVFLFGAAVAFFWWQRSKEARIEAERVTLEAEQRQKAEQAAREQAEATRQQRIMERISDLLLRCGKDLRNEEVQRATITLDEVEHWVTEDGLVEFQPVVARLRAELEMFRDLDGIETVLWVNGGPGAASIARQTGEAFDRYGVKLGQTPMPEILRKVNGSLFRERLLTALDRWHHGTRLAEVRAILKAVDPDSFRDAVRDALAASDKPKLQELAGEAAALEQPAAFILFLCDLDDIDSRRRMELVQNLVLKNPGDFRLSMAMASLWSDTRKANVEALQWYRAATAARPDNPAAWNGVGVSLRRHGDLDGAVAALRKATELRPVWAQFHYELGETLVLRGDIESARDCFQQAISFDPEHAAARLALRNLASVAPLPREAKRP